MKLILTHSTYNVTPRSGKEDCQFNMDGKIIKALGQDKFFVFLENGLTINVYLSGKIRRNQVQVIPGDFVSVRLNTYDLKRGRIIYRYLDENEIQQQEEKFVAKFGTKSPEFKNPKLRRQSQRRHMHRLL
jgi:translation initiation factor IF-1